jgi:hypothetical protein
VIQGHLQSLRVLANPGLAEGTAEVLGLIERHRPEQGAVPDGVDDLLHGVLHAAPARRAWNSRGAHNARRRSAGLSGDGDLEVEWRSGEPDRRFIALPSQSPEHQRRSPAKGLYPGTGLNSGRGGAPPMTASPSTPALASCSRTGCTRRGPPRRCGVASRPNPKDPHKLRESHGTGPGSLPWGSRQRGWVRSMAMHRLGSAHAWCAHFRVGVLSALEQTRSNIRDGGTCHGGSGQIRWDKLSPVAAAGGGWLGECIRREQTLLRTL